jgi:hypothetical protein
VEDLSMSSVEIEKVTWFDIFRILSYFKRTWQIPLECSTTQQKRHRQRAKRKVTTKLMSISGPAADSLENQVAIDSNAELLLREMSEDHRRKRIVVIITVSQKLQRTNFYWAGLMLGGLLPIL